MEIVEIDEITEIIETSYKGYKKLQMIELAEMIAATAVCYTYKNYIHLWLEKFKEFEIVCSLILKKYKENEHEFTNLDLITLKEIISEWQEFPKNEIEPLNMHWLYDNLKHYSNQTNYNLAQSIFDDLYKIYKNTNGIVSVTEIIRKKYILAENYYNNLRNQI